MDEKIIEHEPEPGDKKPPAERPIRTYVAMLAIDLRLVVRARGREQVRYFVAQDALRELVDVRLATFEDGLEAGERGYETYDATVDGNKPEAGQLRRFLLGVETELSEVLAQAAGSGAMFPLVDGGGIAGEGPLAMTGDGALPKDPPDATGGPVSQLNPLTDAQVEAMAGAVREAEFVAGEREQPGDAPGFAPTTFE